MFPEEAGSCMAHPCADPPAHTSPMPESQVWDYIYLDGPPPVDSPVSKELLQVDACSGLKAPPGPPSWGSSATGPPPGARFRAPRVCLSCFAPLGLQCMRREFEYWYPFDVRVSGKDLIQVGWRGKWSKWCRLSMLACPAPALLCRARSFFQGRFFPPRRTTSPSACTTTQLCGHSSRTCGRAPFAATGTCCSTQRR